MHDTVSPVRTKSRTYEYDLAGRDGHAAMTMTGLEYMQAMAAGKISGKPSMAATVGMSAPFDLAHGKASVEADPADFLMNPQGVLHGGFAATLLDSVMGIAVYTALPAATGFTTAELKINYTRAIRLDCGRLRADGTVVHTGRQMATAEGRLIGIDDGKLYAHGSTTCFLFPIAPERG